MSSLSLLSLLATVTLSAGQNPTPDCWYGSFCPYNRDSPFQSLIPQTEDTMLKKMTWCQQKCFDELTCAHFTIHTARGGTLCYLLDSCIDPSDNDACIKDGLCNSGPKDCDTNNNCPMLPEYVDASANKINWQCDGSINPYTQQVPEGQTCFLSCNAWVDDTGITPVPAVITSYCVAGVWTTSVVSPAGLTIPAIPEVLPQPDGAEGLQVACSCAIQPMAWNDVIDYDPNTLPGTDFICTEDYIDPTDPTDLKFNLQPTNVCRLFCDSYHITTMACENGAWTGEPELGAWCYYEPVAADDMNPV